MAASEPATLVTAGRVTVHVEPSGAEEGEATDPTSCLSLAVIVPVSLRVNLSGNQQRGESWSAL